MTTRLEDTNPAREVRGLEAAWKHLGAGEALLLAESIQSLPIDVREEIIEILKKRLAEDRRAEIAANAREALQSVREKQAKYGTVKDLRADLLEE